jgi:hypothetical protein
LLASQEHTALTLADASYGPRNQPNLYAPPARLNLFPEVPHVNVADRALTVDRLLHQRAAAEVLIDGIRSFCGARESRTLADLFHRIRDTMPPGEASTVGETDKLDAVAYLLKQNGFPEGRAELPSDGDTLATIQITGKGGPIPVRTGTLVRTTGCLELRDDREWQLTSATEPARTALDTASKTSSRQDSPQSNARTIVLLNPFPSPAAHRGHRVAATGFLVRRADGDAVNVVSLEMLAPSCMP